MAPEYRRGEHGDDYVVVCISTLLLMLTSQRRERGASKVTRICTVYHYCSSSHATPWTIDLILCMHSLVPIFMNISCKRKEISTSIWLIVVRRSFGRLSRQRDQIQVMKGRSRRGSSAHCAGEAVILEQSPCLCGEEFRRMGRYP